MNEHDYFFSGGFGGGLGVGAFALQEPLICCQGALEVGAGDFPRTDLSDSDMSFETFRLNLWNAYFTSDYQVRYWKLYEHWAKLVDTLVKTILAIGSVFSVAAFMTDPKYAALSVCVAVVSGLISTVLIPVLGLDGYVEKIVGIRNRWIDVRNGYKSVWDELDAEGIIKQRKVFDRWNAIDTELEQENTWTPKIKRLMEKAFAESERLLV